MNKNEPIEPERPAVSGAVTGSANPGWRERAASKQAEAHRLVKLMEDRVSKLTTEEVDAELASLAAWQGAVKRTTHPTDRRSLLVDILYLDLAGSGEDSPNQ